MKRKALFVPLFVAGQALLAQTDPTQMGGSSAPADTNANVFNLSLEDLMDVKVVSASKKAESIFDAPLSISGLTREEIKKSGATSIMEALRLVPGLIVRETSNGNYDVHIRGFADLPPGAIMSGATNSTILVMIDNRPVYNYFNGGTFWETLPVDLNDVDKIEVVRGPSSALYGPNAANGVINIITRRVSKEGVYAVANAQGGTPSTYIGNASVGLKKGKFDFIVSGNYQNRKRFENNYFSWVTDRKVPLDSIQVSFPAGPMRDINGNLNSAERYTSPSTAMDKYGYNSFINYAVNDKVSLGLSAGGQQSIAQVAYIENLATPLSNRLSSSNYADLHGKIYGLTAQVAYQAGTQDVSKGYNGYKYQFNTLDALIEYDINFLNYFTVKPGVNYRSATYDDSKYADVAKFYGFINGKRTLNNLAGSLRAEFDNKKWLKVIAAGRYDTYNYPSNGYLSYQLGINGKINDRNLIRFVYSRSFRGPTMYDVYNSQNLYALDQPIFPGYSVPLYANTVGNNNLKLQQVDMLELGYRWKATDNLHFDIEAFYQQSKNYSMSLSTPLVYEFAGLLPTKITTAQEIHNIKLRAEQTGATIALNFLMGKVQFRPSVTIQQTFLYNVPFNRQIDTANTIMYTDKSNSASPAVYGGAYLNFQATSKLNFNLNAYYYSAYSYVNIYNSLSKDKTKGVAEISDKYLINAKVSYKLMPKLEIFVTARNLFGAKAQEFANTDITKGLYLIGGNFEF